MDEMINYIDDLPLPNHLIPSKLKELLSPIDDSPLNNIEVACAYETTQSREIFCNMTTVTVPLDKINNLPLLYLNHGVVSTVLIMIAKECVTVIIQLTATIH